MDGQIMEWIFRNCHVQPDGGKHFTHHSAMTSGREEYSSGFDISGRVVASHCRVASGGVVGTTGG